MRGTGLVEFGKDAVYTYFSMSGRTARVRLSADDCDRFDLYAGRQLRVGLGGRDPAAALVTAVGPAPPFAWVEFEFPAAAAKVRAG